MTFCKCQGGYKMKRKIIAIVLALCTLACFSSCGNTKEVSVYENVAFENIKTFTEITDIPLNSTVEENTYETTFCYVSFESVDQKINDYKTYLLESGFKITSDLGEDEVAFELDEKTITITFETEDSRTTVNITISCDEATNEARKEAKYEGLIKAAQEEDWNKVYDITGQFSSNEIKNYKDVYAYRLFAVAMYSYELGIFGNAKDYFNDYLENCPEDTLEAKAYIKKCTDKISKYDGTYSGKSYSGLLHYYMFIKDGKVAFEFNYEPLGGISNGYTLGEPTYYEYKLKVNELDKNTASLYLVDNVYFGEFDYKNKLVLEDKKTILVYDFEWDILNWQMDTSPFAGRYTKISNDTPKSKS